jgi:DNA repair exonuclease SbcCD ATPase subunit
MRVSAATAAALALALASLPVAAQSLGEAAAREKARREKAAREGKARPPVKVITEDELRGRVTSGTLSQPAATDTASEAAPQEGSTPAEGAAAPAAAPRPAEPEKSEEELRAERQTEWRQKLQAAQADVARLRARVDQIQAALNDMTGPIYGPNRASIANQLEQSKAALTTAEQTVASLEEEGRRNRYR